MRTVSAAIPCSPPGSFGAIPPNFRNSSFPSFFHSSIALKERREVGRSAQQGGPGKNSNGPDNGNGVPEDLKRGKRPVLNLRWQDLLAPDPDNILAVGLTGLLTWASVQVLGQLFFISIAILLAALKYSFIAALLLFILVTLL